MGRTAAAHLADGQKAEALARDYLRRQGLTVIEHNVRTPYGEIDIVCEHKNALIFVEVRFRRTADFGSPAETVDARKQRKLRASAEHYLQQHPAGSKKAARFDIVAIQGPLPNPRIEWLVNTF